MYRFLKYGFQLLEPIFKGNEKCGLSIHMQVDYTCIR